MSEQFRHICLPSDLFRTEQSYTPPNGGGGGSKEPGAPSNGRPKHSETLREDFESARDLFGDRRTTRPSGVEGAIEGTYIEVESISDWKLDIDGLERRNGKARDHIVVCTVSPFESTTEGVPPTQRATLFVPTKNEHRLIEQFEAYGVSSGKPKKKGVYDRVAKLDSASLRSLWANHQDDFPSDPDAKCAWEVWLRRTDGDELERFLLFAKEHDVGVYHQSLPLADTVVVLVEASVTQLSHAMEQHGDMVQLRKPQVLATPFVNMSRAEQKEWADDLLDRVSPPSGSNVPYVCILDTGVNHTHPLLCIALDEEDCHTLDPNAGTLDTFSGGRGHGTQVAGLALYGDLSPVLAGNASIELTHGLESVKCKDLTWQPALFGVHTATAISLPEIQAPERNRVFVSTLTADDPHDAGEPSSWSASVDALAAGYLVLDETSDRLVYLEDLPESSRLIVMSAGNNSKMPTLDGSHENVCCLENVEDPSQAWNAVTVGACTDLAYIPDDSDWDGFTPVACPGQLSPWSTTSVQFDEQWPIKPEIVLEGGNFAYDQMHFIEDKSDDLTLLSTSPEGRFNNFCGTSASAPLAARIVAIVAAEYPEMWPEMLRALLIHSARWTGPMQEAIDASSSKRELQGIIRQYGWGVPCPKRMLHSTKSCATLYIQDTIEPFCKKKLNQIHFHDLPWPRESLEQLGELPVRLRVTLSYFIEPNPRRRGWSLRHRYASHRLRFGLQRPLEELGTFKARLNQKARTDEHTDVSSKGEADRWHLGPFVQERGSIHSDVHETTAIELASCGSIAVYPVSGWWKENSSADKSSSGVRYALVLSIETDDESIDLYNSLAASVQAEIQTRTLVPVLV